MGDGRIMKLEFLINHFKACNSDWYLVYNNNSYLIKNIVDMNIFNANVDYVEINYEKREVIIL